MRKPIISGNWKMFKNTSESIATAMELKGLCSDVDHCEIIIAPVFTALEAVASKLEGSNIKVAAQNCSTQKDHSAHTGEICADMLSSSGVGDVIIGHSERRQYYGETDETVNQRVSAAIHHGLRAIVCVGESLGEREAGQQNSIRW